MPRSGISAVRARQLASRVPRAGEHTTILPPRATAEQLILSMKLGKTRKPSTRGNKKAPKYTCSGCLNVVPQTEVRIEDGVFYCDSCFAPRPATCEDCQAELTHADMQQLHDPFDGRGWVRVCGLCSARYLPGPGSCREFCSHCRKLGDLDVNREVTVCTNCRHVWRNEHEHKLADTRRPPIGRLVSAGR